MIYQKHITTLVILFSFLHGCKENGTDPVPEILSGVVVNTYTNEPISNVRIEILENGLGATSNADGSFQLAINESADVHDGEVPVSLSHIEYKPVELNASYDLEGQYKLVPDTGTVYHYNEPVQLTDGLQTGTIRDANLDESLVQDLMDRLYGNGYSQIHSVLIYRNNHLVLEEYFYGNNDTINFENNVVVDKTPEHIQWSRNEKHYIASVNKALTSTLIGIALNKSGISINEKISPYLMEYSEYFNDANKAAVEFEDCLNMTAGFEWDEWGSNDLKLLWKSTDFAEFVLSRTNMGPDVEWRYNSALPNLLLKALEELTGSSPRAWADENFYQKLGITDYKWQLQPDGYPEGAARMYLRPRDMIKIGASYLDNGVWNGVQIIPETWIEDCFKIKEITSAGDYSNYFWHRELAEVKYLSADGDGGNYINIFPEQNMVIVITQGNYLMWPFYVNQANSIMKDYIIPAAL